MSAFPHELGAPASLPAVCNRRPCNSSAEMPALPVTTRRNFVKTTLTSAAAIALSRGLQTTNAAAFRDPHRDGLIDTNVTLGRWPFRRLPFDDTSALIAKLRKHGVTQAWTSSFDGLLHKDLAAVNAGLAEACRKHGRGLLVPFGSVNPEFPGWEEELRRCVEEHKLPGLRLHPNYHGYRLDDPAFAKLLSVVSKRRLILQIALTMEDERMHSPLSRVPHVDAAPLVAMVQNFNKLPVILLNWQRAVSAELLRKLSAAGELCVEIATLEGVGGVANLLKQVAPQRVLFGSHAPLFYFESALLKLKESDLEKDHKTAIRGGNAWRLLSQV